MCTRGVSDLPFDGGSAKPKWKSGSWDSWAKSSSCRPAYRYMCHVGQATAMRSPTGATSNSEERPKTKHTNQHAQSVERSCN